MNKKVFLLGLLSSWTIQRYKNRFYEPVKCYNDLKPNFQKALFQKETDLYIWGKGDVNSTSVYTNFHPHKIKQLEGFKEMPNFIDIVFSEQLAVAIDKNHNLYTWKEPKLNSEKNENINNHQRKQIMQLAKNHKVIQAAITKDKIFFITKDGKLLFINYKVTIPENKDSYFTIKSNEEIINVYDDKIIHVKELSNIRSLAAGKDHIIALDKDGNLYGMGDDSYGQLGLDNFSEERRLQMKTYSNFVLRRERKPKKIPVPEPVKKVVCGNNHTLALSVNGNVYGFGSNKYEQLSNDEEYKQGIIGINRPTLLNHDKFQNLEVKDIAASGNCSFFICLDKKNKTYVFFSAGEGLRGCLGQNLIKHISDIDLMPDISGLINENTMSPFEPMKLVCGNKHCLLLFRNPRILYVWGDNEFGELGSKDRLFYESPIPMLEEYNLPFKIMNISAGYHNSAFICERIKKEEKKKLLRIDENKYEEEMSKMKKKKKKEKKEEVKKIEEESSSSYFNKLYNTIKKYI